jgi:hypothetical protein
MVVEWIKQNCEGYQDFADTEMYYQVGESELNDARFNFRSVSDEALKVGSAVHQAIEDWLKTGKEPHNPPEQVLAGFVAFLEFYEQHDMEAIKVEHKVYGEHWGGMLDYYGWFRPDIGSKREIWVLDWKASRGHYPESHGPQIAAYASAVPECEGRCGVVRLDKSTGYPDFKDYTKTYDRYLTEFNLMVPLFMIRHPRIAKAAGWKGN